MYGDLCSLFKYILFSSWSFKVFVMIWEVRIKHTLSIHFLFIPTDFHTIYICLISFCINLKFDDFKQNNRCRITLGEIKILQVYMQYKNVYFVLRQSKSSIPHLTDDDEIMFTLKGKNCTVCETLCFQSYVEFTC